jgi:hypothetical protein
MTATSDVIGHLVDQYFTGRRLEQQAAAETTQTTNTDTTTTTTGR